MKWDPRTLLWLWLWGAALLILTSRLEFLLVELALLLFAVLALRASPAWLGSQRLVVAMTGLVFLITLAAFDLPTALITALRLVALVTLSFLVFRAVSPEEIGAALVHLGAPYPFAFVLTASLQFVPVLRRMVVDIRDAQRARGIDLDAGLAALPRYPALFLPLLVRAFLLAEELAQAMESRGFGRRGRSSLRELRLTQRDWLVMAGAAALTLGVLMLQSRYS